MSLKGFIDCSPPLLQPYFKLIRIDEPTAPCLLFLPCAWSVCLAAAPGTLPDLRCLALLALTSFLMMSAACTINDVHDKDIDRQVTRTKTRPLASGQISVRQALVFFAFQVAGLLAILAMFDTFTMLLGAVSMILFSIYPRMKRCMDWPEAFLGVPINWGALGGWSAIHGGRCAWRVVLPLFSAGMFWTLVYDIIYGHQDKKDDAKIGLRSMSLKFGSQTKYWLCGFSAILIGCMVLTGYMADQSSVYYIGVLLVAAHLAQQIYRVDIDNPQDCERKFSSNITLGIIYCLGIILDKLLKERDDGR